MICPWYDGSVTISWYPLIDVLKHSSPPDVPSAPKPMPVKTVPSARARRATGRTGEAEAAVTGRRRKRRGRSRKTPTPHRGRRPPQGSDEAMRQASSGEDLLRRYVRPPPASGPSPKLGRRRRVGRRVAGHPPIGPVSARIAAPQGVARAGVVGGRIARRRVEGADARRERSPRDALDDALQVVGVADEVRAGGLHDQERRLGVSGEILRVGLVQPGDVVGVHRRPPSPARAARCCCMSRSGVDWR